MELHEKIANIKSKDDLVRFVEDLCEDLRTNPATWENPTLERYLSAFAAWLEDSDGVYINRGLEPPTNPTWRHVADMLIAAKMYE
jgi:hypothetical protein